MIFYLAPAEEHPSWGLAILYHHVKILLDSGQNACIVKEGQHRVPKWLNVDVPFYTVGNFLKDVEINDTVVVPEVMVNFQGLKKITAKKILFLQASCFIFKSLPLGETHKTLGFESVWIILPHMKSIVEKHLQLPSFIIPPFIASYFFYKVGDKRRKKQVLMFPKFDQVDYSIVRNIVDNHIRNKNSRFLQNIITGNNWELKEIKNLDHADVARAMQEAAFFVSLNVFEALNTSVVEALAAGCLVFTYEGFGPRDYLAPEKNAFVFNNNEAFALAETVCEWMDLFDSEQERIESIRKEGYKTASQFTIHGTQEQLLSYFRN